MVDWIPPVILFFWYDATSVHRKSLLYLSKIYFYLIWTLGFLLSILHFSSIYLIKLCKIKISIKIHVHCFETFSVCFILTVTSKYLFWQQAPYIPSPATKKMKTPTTMILMDRLLTTPTLKESTERESRRGLILSLFTVAMSLTARAPTVTIPSPTTCQRKGVI